MRIVFKFTMMFAAALTCAGLLPALADDDNKAILIEQCHLQLQLGDTGCACIGDRAEELMNDIQQQFLVAMVTQDETAGAELRGQMTQEEMTGAGEFFTETPGICATQ